ncbi:MAG: hypothetical protein ACLGHO_13045 [Gammaproteobacteria bacterium]
MASVMDVRSMEQKQARRPAFSAIRWGAIIGGLVGGTATYLLLSLLGVAIGLTAVDPQAAEPVGGVPLATGIWTGISMLVGAFVGGYVAGRMSGLARSVDGMLHGFVSWGATTLLYSVLMVSAAGAILGGTFKILSQGIQGTAQAGSGGNIMDQLAGAIAGNGQGTVNAQTLSALQQAMSAGDRDAAIDIMVSQMGFEPDRAAQTVDRTMPLLGPNAGQTARTAADQATGVATAASWWLFLGLLISLAIGVAGGTAGVRANGRRLVGDHTAEREAHNYSSP